MKTQIGARILNLIYGFTNTNKYNSKEKLDVGFQLKKKMEFHHNEVVGKSGCKYTVLY